VRTLVESPYRRELARRLGSGQTAVWLALRSGDEAKDRAALSRLAAALRRAESEIVLPADVSEEDREYNLPVTTNIPLKVAFSILEIPPADPESTLLRKTLAPLAEGLGSTREPVAVPVFGRARALQTLTGEEITDDNVLQICDFLAGPCSCTVKEMNLGVDLFVPVDWDGLLMGDIGIRDFAPPLLLPGAPERAGGAGADRGSDSQPPARAPRGRLRARLWLAGGIGAILVAAGTARALRKEKAE
jgi:hypothetical protein